jgi:cold shock CspA family protein
MEGTISTYLMSKGYGFIKGDDGNDYFLHQRDTPDGYEPRPGLRVKFDEAATPKGYRARRVRPMAVASTGRYMTPPQVIETKQSEFPDWEVLESVPWHIIGTSRESPDAARGDLQERARELGANAVMLVEYFKTQGAEAGTGRGMHHFTIHNFRAVPALVGRASESGGHPKEELFGLSRKVTQVATGFAKKMRVRRKWGWALIIVGVILIPAGFALLGPSYLAPIPGVVLLYISRDFFQPLGVWLIPMVPGRRT